ncbi:hypothetical protein [Magnetospirillum fulvum]|uniref:VanZ-like domain-containing protein n=1 Tax=Magnetospirillum fulvum MGU-K5 TaxID=1316936 RepID=S9S751_MAGFU|nr:hypothetical protein [Magnetospirillum fulvum]EPY01677.1 hypothetical protein K678_09858 [Magnetospirillum fulvum MGU-K5]
MTMAQASIRSIAVRLLAWIGLIGLALLSWLPGDEMIRSGLDGRIEHVMAYAGISTLVALAYARRIGLKAVAALLILYAGMLEIGQIFAFGRHAALWDAFASGTGILIGTALHPLIRSGARRRRPLHHFLSSLTD